MYVADLALTDFRSYRDVVLAFPPGVSVLVGPNGQGKTNLVEAVGYLATFSSHRVAGDAALVREGADRAVVRCRAVRGDRSAVVEIEIVAGRANRARLNRAPVSRVRDVLGVVRAVVFAPEDLALIKGEPEGRRRFLDDLLVMRAPRFAAVRAGYDRVLRQRGALLRSLRASSARGARVSAEVTSTLDVWDGQLAATGAQLVSARRGLVADLTGHVATAYERVSGAQGAARLTYRASTDSPDDPEPPETAGTEVPAVEAGLLAAMARRRPQEIERGVCLVGPHRDDLALAIGSLPARGFASHGESWSLALALRLGSYDLLRADTSGEWSEGGEPVLILDDVFAELDAGRRARLAGLVSDADQVLVTAAAAEDVPTSLDGARYDVADGAVSRVR